MSCNTNGIIPGSFSFRNVSAKKSVMIVLYLYRKTRPPMKINNSLTKTPYTLLPSAWFHIVGGTVYSAGGNTSMMISNASRHCLSSKLASGGGVRWQQAVAAVEGSSSNMTSSSSSSSNNEQRKQK